MTYDNDYYAQGKESYRLHPLLQPVLAILYRHSVQTAISKVSGLPSVRRRALDVGAGRGEFLYYLRKKGWDVAGTQISKAAISAAKRSYEIELLERSLPLASELGKFDLITYWHSFEHIDNPREHLVQVRDLLRDYESTLIIEVPNPESLGAKICFGSWLGSDVEHHVNLLSRSGLHKIVTESGLKVVRSEAFSLKFAFVYLYSALCGWFSRGVLDCDYFLSLLKRPYKTLSGSWQKAVLWIVVSPLAIALAIILAPLGMWFKRPETIRLYIRKSDSKNGLCLSDQG
jgi:2-polyprenyl-3-methyl-5-hydroxy-6-metoxy-1,4-benzoquinol methylase